MTYRGHVRNGQITLDEPARLPEGARVHVQVLQEPTESTPLQQQHDHRRRDFEPIRLPGGPLADDIIRDRR